jgi:hypothetical protein
MRPFWTRPAVNRLQVAVAAPRPLKAHLPAKVRVVGQAELDRIYALSASRRHDVRVVVVDVDALGVGALRDLRRVFPYMRLVAVASDLDTLRRAKAAGATATLRRGRVERGLAYAILGR